MYTFKKLALFGLAASTLVAQSMAYFWSTQPIQATNWDPQQTHTVQWQPQLGEGEVAPSAGSTYQVWLMTGGDLEQIPIMLITPDALPISQTSFDFYMPNLNPGLYFLKYVASEGLVNWSTRFSVLHGSESYPALITSASATATTTSETPAEPTDEPTTTPEVTDSVTESVTATDSESDSAAPTGTNTETTTEELPTGTTSSAEPTSTVLKCRPRPQAL
ncbi:hypothetical protein H4R33_007253 [Dimargaris cristalligena]|nr:hypothetical protein H4R33_007253 [Dimargaris cristalligena]